MTTHDVDNMATKVKTQPQSNYHHGNAIKRLRQGELLTQQQLGDRVGMTQQTIYRYEKEERLEDDVIQRLAEALGVTADFIKTMEEDKSLVNHIHHNTITSPINSNNSIVNNGTQITNALEDDKFEAILKEIKSLSQECQKQCQTMTEACKEIIGLYKKEIQVLEEQLRVQKEKNHLH